jgi:hypothetical protein
MSERESDANANVIDPPENTKAEAEAQTEDDAAAAIDPPSNDGGN